jgi:hypothetical protein
MLTMNCFYNMHVWCTLREIAIGDGSVVMVRPGRLQTHGPAMRCMHVMLDTGMIVAPQ